MRYVELLLANQKDTMYMCTYMYIRKYCVVAFFPDINNSCQNPQNPDLRNFQSLNICSQILNFMNLNFLFYIIIVYTAVV